MTFPSWIEATAEKDPERHAQLRLKYMLSAATLRRYGHTSIRRLAAESGLNHSSIFCAIKRGWFTESMAERIELALAPVPLPAAHLVNPQSADGVNV